MRLLSRLRSIVNGGQKKADTDEYRWKKLEGEDDPMMELAVNAAFKTGEAQIGNINDDGSFTFNGKKFDTIEDAKKSLDV